MMRCTRVLRYLRPLVCTLLMLLVDALRFLLLCLRPSPALAAEHLLLRKQLALYQERGLPPTRATDASRMALIGLARWFDWRRALVIVQPQTLIRWHRQGFRLCWRWQSNPGRPLLPADLRVLIRRMARENPSWGEERIANALLLTLGLQVSPRPLRKYLLKRQDHDQHQRASSHRWLTCVRHHAKVIVACDFCVMVTATFRILYGCVVMEHATRRMLHATVTAHPTAPWTLPQRRVAVLSDHVYRFLLHDRDRLDSQPLDQSACNLGLQVPKTPPQRPQASALCERLVGTLRRECLDFVIPLTENHLRRMLQEWVPHDHAGHPHMSLGPGISQPSPHLPVSLQAHRHRLPEHLRVVAHAILGGLPHDYCLKKKAA